MIPDQITIGDVTISRKQWKIINQHGNWKAFVAANAPKPEHWDGEPCKLPVHMNDRVRAEGFRFLYTGKEIDVGIQSGWFESNCNSIMYAERGQMYGKRWELRAVRIEPEHVKGEKCTAPMRPGENMDGIDHFLFNELVDCVEEGQYFLADVGEIWRANGRFSTPHWTLTAVPKKPAPRYDVGKWVVEDDAIGLCKIVGIRDEWRIVERPNGVKGEYNPHISNLRPAVREDFMVTYRGVKVWMEKHGDEIMGRVRGDKCGGGWILEKWEAEIWKAAGVLPMPEEFWT